LTENITQEVVLDRDRFSKFLEQYTPLTYYGDNIVASDGEKWKKYRKIAGPAFSDVSTITLFCKRWTGP
jgi:cytochrome P450